jgi:SAM-dependent methyltransferase/DNA-binding MarR family transcriptional regulator
LLRRLLELTDGSTDGWYKEQGFNYRPRYTPIMRTLIEGPVSVSDIQGKLSVTQGAVSQTIKLMLEDRLIEKKAGEDARQSIVSLSADGKAALQQLKPHWEATFAAIRALEGEIQLPLMNCLTRAVEALEKKSYADRINDSKRNAIDAADETRSNYFDIGGEHYARFRPAYPPELATSMAALVSTTELALDVGCGNGQLTSLLGPHFQHVVGIDPSESQLDHAELADNLTYLPHSAENIGLPDNSVDLIVVAQAAHWFDLDRFYSEARRVARKDAVIALVSYGVPYVSAPVNAVFQRGYWQDIHEFWPPERAHVETGYADLYFPFTSIDFPDFSCHAEMTVEQFIGYIRTWSAYPGDGGDGGQKKFDNFFNTLRVAWPENQSQDVFWPISVRAARVH